MATEWYYSKDEQQLGPISVKELRELSSSGDIVPSDLVWKEGMSTWVPASKVKGLFAESDGSTLSAQAASAAPSARVWLYAAAGAFLALFLLVSLFSFFGPSQRKSSLPGKDDARAEANGPERKPTKKPRRTGPVTSSSDDDIREMPVLDDEERLKALVLRIKPGMTTRQVESILGTPDDTEEKEPVEGYPHMAGKKFELWTWSGDGEDQPSIVLSFLNGKLQDGGTPGYDIRKGFKSKLPGNMSADEKKKLKDAAKKLGIATEDD